MSPASASPDLVQSSEVSQTAAPVTALALPDGPPRRKLKVCHTPVAALLRSGDFKYQSVNGRRVMKRKRVIGGSADEQAQFKSTKRTKKYLEKPFDDPNLERTRLNAINAKKNRDRKKQEFQALNQICEDLSSENRELDKTNKSLEARLQAAEEEIAFLRRALLNGVGAVRSVPDGALKSMFGGNTAPAGG